MINVLETSVLVPQRKNKSNKGEQNLGKRNSTVCVVFYYKMSSLTDLQVQESPSEATSVRGQ